MTFFTPWIIIPLAVVLDLILGDPRSLPHPVRWMGTAISGLEPWFRRLPVHLCLSGTLFAAVLIVGAAGSTLIVTMLARMVHPVVAGGLELLLIYYCISARSLSQSARTVADALIENHLVEAREKVSMIVGRDTRTLTRSGVIRAGVETVAENFVDGVAAPLLFAAIGGAPLAMAYKMINTLDSMVGYKNDTYGRFGKAAARIDDVVNLVPARGSVFVIALAAQLLNGKGGKVLKTARNEGRNHTSPNAGYPEAAFAGALGVQLGGPSTYQGLLVSKPFIGTGLGDVTVDHIQKACDLMLLSSLLWAGILTAALMAADWFI